MVRESELSKYLDEIGKHKLLTREEEVDLARRAQDRALSDRDRHKARERMIVSNLRLVVQIAKPFARGGLLLHDLVAEGNMGLLKAVERFDPNRGFRFSTYATWWIRQSVQVCARQFRRGSKLNSGLTENSSPAGTASPGLDGDAERGAIPAIRGSLRPATCGSRTVRMVSLDELLSRQASGQGDEPLVISSLDLEKVQRVLRVLDSREQRVLRLRYGLTENHSPMTLGEIGKELGITRERVRQLEERAILKLQREFRKTAV